LPRAEIAVSPAEGTVGDRLQATVSVVVPEGVEVERPDPGPEWGRFAVTDAEWEGPEEVPGGTRWVWRGKVAAYETGTLELPGVEVVVVSDGERRVLRTGPVEIEIVSVLSPEDEAPEIADLKAPVAVAPDFGPLLGALGIVGALAVVAAVAWWLHRRFGARLAAVPQVTDPFHRMPPHEWVYEELRRLLDRRLAEEGRVEEFFAELSHIVKQYLGGRYRIDLLERTTSEVKPDLQQAGAPSDPVQATVELLRQADTVKFARGAPDAAACRDAVEEAYRIVDATRPAKAEGGERRGAA
jgi:hypothetical protein